jgi:hypothetical protein
MRLAIIVALAACKPGGVSSAQETCALAAKMFEQCEQLGSGTKLEHELSVDRWRGLCRAVMTGETKQLMPNALELFSSLDDAARAQLLSLLPTMTMRNVLISLTAALTLSLGGCSKKDPAEKMIAMMEDVGNAVDQAGGDCGKAADAVEAITKKYDLPALKAEAEKMRGDKAAAEAMAKKYGDRMKAVTPKLMALVKCVDDPKMKALNAKFKGLM